MPWRLILFRQEFLRGSYSANQFPPHLFIIHLYICIDFCEKLHSLQWAKWNKSKTAKLVKNELVLVLEQYNHIVWLLLGNPAELCIVLHCIELDYSLAVSWLPLAVCATNGSREKCTIWVGVTHRNKSMSQVQILGDEGL